MIKVRLVKFLGNSKKYIGFQIVWQWMALVTQIVAVFSIANLLESALQQEMTVQKIRNTIIILLAVVSLRVICEWKASKASYLASTQVKKVLRSSIYDKLLRLGASYREQTATSEVVQISTEGVEQLETYFGKYLPQLFYSLLAPFTLFVVLSFVNLKSSIVLLICVPLIPVSIVAVQKLAKKLLNKYWGIYTDLGDSFLENLQGLTTLKIYQADEKKAQEMDEEAQRFRKITMKVLTMQLNSTSVMDIIAYGGAAIGMVVAVNEFLKGNIDFSGTLTILLLASEFFIPLRLLGSFFHIAMNGMAASDKIFHLLDMEEPEQGTEKAPEGNQDISFQQVHFSYEDDREILKGISIHMPVGKLISLVGESGCGKSTAASLLAGKHKKYQGAICIGDTPVSKIKESELMKYITVVRHNSYLFKGTVEENLKMAKPDATREEMEAVLKKVNLLDFLNNGQGLQTQLLEKAGNLSGGQCQRLALARALLYDTPVYILDEATSNIDAESEEQIMKVVHEMAEEKTVLLISHRLSNVVNSYCIYMMEQGEIKEWGNHSELMEKKESYYKLFESQRQLEQYRRV